MRNEEDIPAVEVRGLGKSFPRTRGWLEFFRHPFKSGGTIDALVDLEFSVGRGKALAVLGPNGAGKSTLLKILSCLVEPDAGEATVLGMDVRRQPNSIQEVTGLAICDERSFYWRLSARQNLEFFAALQGLRGKERNERLGYVMSLVGVLDQADRPFRDLSTGMKQRMALARALLNMPKVLLVDEPTRSLDPGSSAKLRRFLKEELLGRQGVTLLLATHDLDEAREVSDEVMLLDNGRKVAHGSVADVMPAVESLFELEEEE